MEDPTTTDVRSRNTTSLFVGVSDGTSVVGYRAQHNAMNTDSVGTALCGSNGVIWSDLEEVRRRTGLGSVVTCPMQAHAPSREEAAVDASSAVQPPSTSFSVTVSVPYAHTGYCPLVSFTIIWAPPSLTRSH